MARLISSLLVLSLICGAVMAETIVVIDFEDLDPGEEKDYIKIPDGYQGFNWSNRFRCTTRIRESESGYDIGRNGRVVAYNSGRKDISMQSANGQLFDLIGTYVTAAWKENLDFTIEGWRDGMLIHSVTTITDRHTQWWFDLNFEDIDTVWFRSGTRNYEGGTHLAIDDILIRWK